MNMDESGGPDSNRRIESGDLRAKLPAKAAPEEPAPTMMMSYSFPLTDLGEPL